MYNYFAPGSGTKYCDKHISINHTYNLYEIVCIMYSSCLWQSLGPPLASIGNESVPIQLAQSSFPGLAISNAIT